MEVKIIGQMDNTIDHTFESANRVYDKNGISPTINTCGGGGLQPKVIDENIIIGGMQKHQAIKKDGICTTLTSSMGTGGGYIPMVLSDKSIVAMRGRNPDNPSDRTVGSPTEQRLEPNSQGICNTLTSVQKDNLVLESAIGVTLFESDEFGGWKLNKEGLAPTIRAQKVSAGAIESVKIKQATKEGYVECKIGGVADLSFPSSTTRRGRVQDNGDTCPTLMAGEQDICRIETQYRIRKLTPMECWRLMDFSQEDFLSAKLESREVAKEILEEYPHLGKRAFTEVQRLEKMSNSQLYKQAGNSICKNVLVAIFGQMLDGKEDVYKEINSTHFPNQQQ